MKRVDLHIDYRTTNLILPLRDNARICRQARRKIICIIIKQADGEPWNWLEQRALYLMIGWISFGVYSAFLQQVAKRLHLRLVKHSYRLS